jgi:hypothetical protein
MVQDPFFTTEDTEGPRENKNWAKALYEQPVHDVDVGTQSSFALRINSEELIF